MQYGKQCDLAFTNKYQSLTTVALFHVSLFYKVRDQMMAAAMLDLAEIYYQHRKSLLIIIEA